MDYDNERNTLLYRESRTNRKKVLYGIAIIAFVVVGVYMVFSANSTPFYKTPENLEAPSFKFSVTQDEADQFEDRINLYRCMHDVQLVEWNDVMYDDIEATFGEATEMQHSDCYHLDDEQGGPAGENLFWGSPGGAWSASDAVDAWYEEYYNCGPFPGCNEGASGTTGHFTAMIWAGVTEIACTISNADDGAIKACRFGAGPGSSLSYDTPNMGGGYEANVPDVYWSMDDCAKKLKLKYKK